jgi:hypothetical protein
LGEGDDQDERMLPVSITISIVAVLVALVSLLGHRARTRSILAQNRMNDAWVHYQSTGLGLINYDALFNFLSFAQLKDSSSAELVRAKYHQQIAEAGREQKESEARAISFEREVEHREIAADRFDLTDVLLEAAVVFISITLLTKRWLYWGIGLAFACVGLVIAATGLLVS